MIHTGGPPWPCRVLRSRRRAAGPGGGWTTRGHARPDVVPLCSLRARLHDATLDTGPALRPPSRTDAREVLRLLVRRAAIAGARHASARRIPRDPASTPGSRSASGHSVERARRRGSAMDAAPTRRLCASWCSTSSCATSSAGSGARSLATRSPAGSAGDGCRSARLDSPLAAALVHRSLRRTRRRDRAAAPAPRRSAARPGRAGPVRRMDHVRRHRDIILRFGRFRTATSGWAERPRRRSWRF